MNYLKQMLAGSGIYLALELTSYIGEMAGDRLSSSLTVNLLGITTLLGFFLPGLVAGYLACEKPLVVGSGLGIIVIILYFMLSVIFLGWDWAVAGIRLSPVAIPLLFAFTVVFTFGGYTAAKRSKSRPSESVT